MAKKGKKFEVRDHVLVPKHEKLSKSKAKELFEEYNISVDHLPKIKKNDPALKSMDVEVGDVIKITRNSSTAGESVYYRVVVLG